MNKDIKYSGYSAVPSDYECPDGELSTAINLINEDGAIRPVFPPCLQIKQVDGNCIYIHKNTNFTHYILQKGNSYSWFSHEEPDKVTFIATITGISHINSIGNTLIFFTADGMQYYLWKGKDTGYISLGTHIPECPLTFGLQGQLVNSAGFTITFSPHLDGWTRYAEFNDENKTHVSNQVLAQVNKYIADNSVNKGKFIFPFFVRYAYRLYDGTLTMHSAPVLMIASSDITPHVPYTALHPDDDGNTGSATAYVSGVVHTLDYAAILQSRIDMLGNWNDIVRSVDVFISKPIYTYDQNGKCVKLIESKDVESYCVCKHINQNTSRLPEAKYPLRYQKQSFNQIYSNTFDGTYPGGYVVLPRRTTEAVKEDIRSTNLFYLLRSLKIDELTTERTTLDINEEYLPSLTTREVMTDDYDSHDTIIPSQSFAYNSRLNLSGIRKRLYDLYNAASMLCYTDGYIIHSSGEIPTLIDYKVPFTVFFYIRQDGKEIVLQGETGYIGGRNAPYIFLYYPNVNAYKAVIKYQNSTVAEVRLEQHAFLNGAFYFNGWDNPSSPAVTPQVSTDDERTVELLNKIYTSEVNNSFVFPVLGINTVGTGEIKGVCSAAKALSEGQFGQFPLYAFTTEGVWALEVSSTGTYSARQPITRDVCINADGIAQLDNAVLFPTDRGIMLISGSQTQCISDTISSEFPFNALELPKFEMLHGMLGHDPITDKCLPTLPFTEFLTKCRMIYDYVHQRVIVYAPDITYAYVYSMKSKQWGMTFSNITSHLNSYPDALAIDNDNNIVNFSKTDTFSVKGLLLSRPLKMDMPDIHKTISSVIQRGYFRPGHVQSVLYGSRDLIHWHLVWSSKDHRLCGFRGTPYKYFRIACLTTLESGESLHGASVQFTPRLTNQPR